jgi:hypothetical protein
MRDERSARFGRVRGKEVELEIGKAHTFFLSSFASYLQIVYFGRCLPLVIIDRISYFNKWKLQPVRPPVLPSFFLRLSSSSSPLGFAYLQGKVPTAREQWECTKLVLLSHFTVELPQVSQVL